LSVPFQDQGEALKEPGIEEAAKLIARRRKLEPTLLELLSKWWRDKYSLPSNHNLFQDSTILALLTEFYEDQYYDTTLEVYRNEKGDVQFVKTRDKVIDRWEQELAEGKVPNYLDTFSEEQIDKLNRMRDKGTDFFGKSVPSSSGTLRDATDAVLLDRAHQGLGVPPAPFQRFGNKDVVD
jgi:hypothetical protein